MIKKVTAKQIEKALTPNKLRAFFSANPTARFKTGSCTSCAVAKYLRNAFNVSPKSVDVGGGNDLTVQGVCPSYVPDWVKTFISVFDREGSNKYVSGKRSKEILLDVAYRTA